MTSCVCVCVCVGVCVCVRACVCVCVCASMLNVTHMAVCEQLQNARLQSGVRKFNERFNREVFEPRGMYWSTQHCEYTTNTGDCSFTTYVVSSCEVWCERKNHRQA